jgi:hypothetical protein
LPFAGVPVLLFIHPCFLVLICKVGIIKFLGKKCSIHKVKILSVMKYLTINKRKAEGKNLTPQKSSNSKMRASSSKNKCFVFVCLNKYSLTHLK